MSTGKLLFLVTVLTFVGVIIGVSRTVEAAPPKVSLEQCRNGAAATPNDCEALGGGTGWVSGNAGASQAHFIEGHSIPYRAVATDLTLNTTITLDLGYDITHSGKNAIDFLTHYDRLEPHNQFGHPAEDVDPTSGVSGLSASTVTCAIPKPSNLPSPGASDTFDALPAGEKLFTIFGGTECSVTQISNGDLAASQSEASIRVTFKVDSATAVFAWGGHIATSQDWGVGNSAAGISGSPYHMRTLGWSLGNLGQQDRSLSAAAVIAQASSVVTQIHQEPGHETVVPIGGSAPLGSTVHDKATVTGASPTGSVDFTFYRGGDCTTGAAEAAGSVALVGGVADPSQSEGPLAADSYAFKAAYGGDLNNLASESACEPFSIDKGELVLSTAIHLGDDHTTNYDTNANSGASVAAGSIVHDVAFVSGQVGTFVPTGAITFMIWNNGTCTDPGTALGTAGADEGGTGTRSVDTSALSPGTYSFKAFIAADANYEATSSPCETLVVDKGVPTLTTAPFVYPNDSASISDLLDPQAGSTLVFTAHTSSDCSAASQIYTQTFNNIVNTSYETTNSSVKVDEGSTVWWKVAYSGDANNEAMTSNCVENVVLSFTSDP